MRSRVLLVLALLAAPLAGCLEPPPATSAPPASTEDWTLSLARANVTYDRGTDAAPPVFHLNATWHGPGVARVERCTEGPLAFVLIDGAPHRLDWHPICKALGTRDVQPGESILSSWTFDGTYRSSPSGPSIALPAGVHAIVGAWENATARGTATLVGEPAGVVVEISPREAAFTGARVAFVVTATNRGDEPVSHPLCGVEPTLEVVIDGEARPFDAYATCMAFGNTTLAPGESIERRYEFDGKWWNRETGEREAVPQGEHVLEARFLSWAAEGKLVIA